MNEVADIIRDIVEAGIRSNVTKVFHAIDEDDQIKYESAIYQLNRITGIDVDWLDGLVRRTHVNLKGENDEKS